jgi:hypothetical protein
MFRASVAAQRVHRVAVAMSQTCVVAAGPNASKQYSGEFECKTGRGVLEPRKSPSRSGKRTALARDDSEAAFENIMCIPRRKAND